MTPEEEKKDAGRELTDQGSLAQAPAENAAPEEEKKPNYWLLSLVLIFLLLAGGGYYALTGMRQAAQELAGGAEYDRLSANSSIYDGGAAAARNGDYFPLDEEAARAQVVGRAAGPGPASGRLNPALARTREELAADAAGPRAAPAADEAAPAYPGTPGSAPGGQAVMAERLQARASFAGGTPGAGSSKGRFAGAEGPVRAFQGGSAAAGRASNQRETKAAAPNKAGRGSVMESLRSAFRAAFYGARLSSQDSARNWTARSFDAAPEAGTAIQYDDKMRAKLDKVNPDAVPGFLREQEVSAAEAKRLAVSEVGKPKLDSEGTEAALAADQEYQAKKLAGEFSGSMLNGLFAGVSGTGSEGLQGRGGSGGSGEPGGADVSVENFADPEETQSLVDAELQDYIDTNGFGAECGCTAEAPCCCVPGAGSAGVEDGSLLWAGPDSGDFSTGGDGLAFA